MSYRIIYDDECITICSKSDCKYTEGFIDIYVDGDRICSPFKDVDDAKLFAEIIIRLLKGVSK